MPSNDIHIGNYTLQSLGSVGIQASGQAVSIDANGETSSLLLTGSALALLQSGTAILNLKADGPAGSGTFLAGEAGSIKIAAGVPDVGSSMLLEPEMITISVGAPGAGACIKLTPESITISVGEVSFSMTPAGIVEDVAECSRELTPEGHNLTAAETELNVGVAGETKALPTADAEIEAGSAQNQTLGDITTDAAFNLDAAVAMVV